MTFALIMFCGFVVLIIHTLWCERCDRKNAIISLCARCRKPLRAGDRFRPIEGSNGSDVECLDCAFDDSE
jgi:hypothetical protein